MRRPRRLRPRVLVLVALVGALAPLAGATGARAAAPLVARESPADPSTYDPYFGEQWALGALNVPAAWLRSTGRGVRVGVVDTGVDLTHEDLAGKIAASAGCIGAETTGSCAGGAQDDEGHGTHVAGIVAADTFNGKGVAGVAPDALLVVAKALDANGSGAVGDVNAAIHWVVDHGAQVVNLSLEADGTALSATPGQSLSEGVEYAWHHGAIPVVAAGNATPSLFGAAGYAGVDAVIVGATGRSGQPAWYSSALTGAKWGVVAPGGDARGPGGTASCAGPLASGCIVSTGWFRGHADAYAVDEGTSMAAPEVSGVLALLLGEGLTPRAAIGRLLATTTPVACGPGCGGAVDAAAAAGATPATTFTTVALHPSTTAAPPVAARVGIGAVPVAAGPPPSLPSTTTEVPRAGGGPLAAARPTVAASLPGRPDRDQNPWAVVVAAVLLVVVSAQAATAVRRRQP